MNFRRISGAGELFPCVGTVERFRDGGERLEVSAMLALRDHKEHDVMNRGTILGTEVDSRRGSSEDRHDLVKMGKFRVRDRNPAADPGAALLFASLERGECRLLLGRREGAGLHEMINQLYNGRPVLFGLHLGNDPLRSE